MTIFEIKKIYISCFHDSEKTTKIQKPQVFDSLIINITLINQILAKKAIFIKKEKI